MSDQQGGSAGDQGTSPGDEPTSRLGARAPWARKDPAVDDGVKHSALVGFMSVPVHRRFPIRRSTLAMAVAFLGLGTLLYFNAPQSDATTSPSSGSIIRTPDGDFVVPGATKVTPATSTTTTTRPPAPTTTTMHRSATTTTLGSTTTTTTLGNPTTTTTSRVGSGTTTTTTTQATTGTGTGGTSRSTTTTTTAP